MKSLHYYDEPLRVFGVPFFDETKKLQRLPEDIREKIPALSFLGRRCPGARLCFRTDASEFTVKIRFEDMSLDMGMSIYSCQSAFVMVGDRKNPTFAGLVKPSGYDEKSFEKTIKKEPYMEDVIIFLPRNEVIEDIEIAFDDSANIEKPTPYRDIKPILYYGSSITEGGHASVPFNAYNSILSSRLDVDYYNMGFSSSAMGEIELAEYFCNIDMSVFVYDYDYNAPSVEHLRNTHEAFFSCIREKKPNLPVIIMSKPAVQYTFDDKERRSVIKDTYNNALMQGDKNVYFIDGETFFGDKERFRCSLDNIHPNDVGMIKMADTIEPLLKKILKNIAK